MNRAQRRAAKPEVGLDPAALLDGERRRLAAVRQDMPDWAAGALASYEQMLEIDGERMAFETTRKPDADRTFSREAIEVLRENVTTFVMSRIFRQWRDTGIPPSAMDVRLEVSLK